MSQTIDQSIANFQSALKQEGQSLEKFIGDNYIGKWRGDALYHAMRVRTTMVNAMHNFLTDYGLLNMERVSMSPVTDPLAHDIEHSPSIEYKGHSYMTTHSMIYSKFLACFNPKIKGVFVDSPNIRLEIESPVGSQRKKYLADFSQMDIELRRGRGISLQDYLNKPSMVKEVLKEDMNSALSFFEDLIIHAMTALVQKNEDDLKALGVVIEVPTSPFPRYRKDEAEARYGAVAFESRLGGEAKSQFYWVTGLMRENYDLIYPYLNADGSKTEIKDFTSDCIFNYDMVAQGIQRDTGKFSHPYEICSGAIREWLYEPIVERLIDNRVISARPVIKGGVMENIDTMNGYGPFLLAVSQKDSEGRRVFPDTFGGGVGIERTLFSLLQGKCIDKVDDVTLFGKNPDSHPLFLF